MLIADLENQTLIFYQIDKNWYAIDKVNESDVPSSIEAIKDGTITDYINSINYFKDLCVDMKASLAQQSTSMKAITKSKSTRAPPSQRPLWFSNYTDNDN
ncbi:unnamed protein product [Mucor fragilis]